MLVINWLQLKPTKNDWERATQNLNGVVHIRTLIQALVRSILQAHPWEGRDDLIPVFDPSKTFKVGDYVAFPEVDLKKLRPDFWQIGVAKNVSNGANPVQGSFQVVTFDNGGRKNKFAAEVPNGHPLLPSFPPSIDEDLDYLVRETTNTFLQPLTQVVDSSIQSGLLKAFLNGDQILLGGVHTICGEEEKYYLSELFTGLSLQNPVFTTDEIITRLRELGCLIEVHNDFARFVMEKFLEENSYRNLGGNLWTTTELFEIIDRDVIRRMKVPVIRSRLAQELGEDDSLDATNYEEIGLNPNGLEALQEQGEEESQEETLDREFQPPTFPVGMAPLTYIQIIQGFFPLTSRLRHAFNPDQDPTLVLIQIIEGEPIPFLVSRQGKIIKALDPEQFRSKFLNLTPPIPAGTYLSLEYQGGINYRIAPNPQEKRIVKCKLVRYENGNLLFEEMDFPTEYEGNPHLLKAELRFEDIKALFLEAERSGLSIFDAMWYTFPKIAKLHPQGYVHRNDLFNAIFFQIRMCSPRSVVTELYTRPCFIPVGDGYFRFEPERGIRRNIGGQPMITHTETTRHPEPTAAPQPFRYFIFQQKTQPEYADQIGFIYNWRKGIPGSNQITTGSRFVYYRTGEKIFFGTGRINRIQEYQDSGITHFNGHIVDFENWEPPLQLTKDLAQRLQFVSSDRLWVGQAGIKQIRLEDFECLCKAYLESKTISRQPLTKLEQYIQAYKNERSRVNVLFCRQVAHARIRSLLGQDNLQKLTLAEFNNHIWQLGTVVDSGHTINVTTDEWWRWIHSKKLSDLKTSLKSGKLEIIGNQTWGSGTHIIGPMLKLPDTKLEKLVKKTLANLLYNKEAYQERFSQTIDEPNGFGINITTGILHAMFPDEHVLYNQRSIDGLKQLSIDWPRNWQNHTAYTAYRDWCHEIKTRFNFQSLSDVDWFMYCLSLDLLSSDKQLDELPDETNSEKKIPSPITDTDSSEKFWSEVKKLAGQRISTLGEEAPLIIEEVDDKAVRMRVVSTGNPYPIFRVELVKVWFVLKKRGELLQTAIRDDLKLPNPTYAASILAMLPGVSYEVNPIRLIIKENPDSQPNAFPNVDESLSPPPLKLERTRSGQYVAPKLIPQGPLFEQSNGEVEGKSEIGFSEQVLPMSPSPKSFESKENTSESDIKQQHLKRPNSGKSDTSPLLKERLEELTESFHDIVNSIDKPSSPDQLNLFTHSTFPETSDEQFIMRSREIGNTITIEREENVQTKEAFETLLKPLLEALNAAKEGVAQASAQGNFSLVVTLGKRCEDLQAQVQNLENLQKNWGTLIYVTSPASGTRKVRQDRKHLSPGQKTPNRAFRLPILLALEEKGGKGPVAELLQRVEEMVKPDLKSVDYELIQDGRTIRWRNTAGWERDKMVKEGLLKSDSSRGVWEITEKGRALIKNSQR
jgi:restriction system protein